MNIFHKVMEQSDALRINFVANVILKVCLEYLNVGYLVVIVSMGYDLISVGALIFLLAILVFFSPKTWFTFGDLGVNRESAS